MSRQTGERIAEQAALDCVPHRLLGVFMKKARGAYAEATERLKEGEPDPVVAAELRSLRLKTSERIEMIGMALIDRLTVQMPVLREEQIVARIQRDRMIL